MKNYEELNELQIDTLREIGSIGTGNAATSLSAILNTKIMISNPEVRIMGYNEAISWIGGPENITAGVLVNLSGEINGVILAIQQLDFANIILSNTLFMNVDDYSEIGEMEKSALVEVGNIMISTFMNAISSLSDTKINLSVPGFAIDMQGAILAVPMAEYGGQTDNVIMLGANFVCDGQIIPSKIILSPDIMSLEFLLKKLGV